MALRRTPLAAALIAAFSTPYPMASAAEPPAPAAEAAPIDPLAASAVRALPEVTVTGRKGDDYAPAVSTVGAKLPTELHQYNTLFFVNNDIRAVRVGVYSSGASAGSKNQNLVINQNIMTAAAPNNVGETGIYAAFTNNILVSGKNIDNIIRTGSPDNVAINIGFGAVNGFAVTTTGLADGVSNVTISNNNVGVISNSGHI